KEFVRCFLLIPALQVEALADAAEMNHHEPLRHFVRLAFPRVRPMLQARLPIVDVRLRIRTLGFVVGNDGNWRIGLLGQFFRFEQLRRVVPYPTLAHRNCWKSPDIATYSDSSRLPWSTRRGIHHPKTPRER